MAVSRSASFELLDVPGRDQLGEGPWWQVSEQRLYWVDILGHLVRSSDLDGKDAHSWGTGTETGFAVPDAAGGLVLGLRQSLGRLDTATGQVTTGVVVDDRLDHRLNDGKTDRAGRLWFGSMHLPETEPTSRFYRTDATGTATVFDDIITSNGLGWSPDNSTMYYTDSKVRQIWAFDFDAETGAMTNRRVFAEDPRDRYAPDGLTVDAEGCVWGAKWQGHKVVRYAPDGTVMAEWEFPVARMTSCMFAGNDLGTLAITSARGPQDDEPLAGRVFLIDPGVKGLPETPVTAEVLAKVMA